MLWRAPETIGVEVTVRRLESLGIEVLGRLCFKDKVERVDGGEIICSKFDDMSRSVGAYSGGWREDSQWTHR